MLVPGLYQFFRRQLQHGFGEQGLAEPATVDYVSDVLTRFAHTRALYLIQDAEGAPIETVAGLLTEWHRSQGWDDAAPDRAREALVVRHLGEFTLFMSGLFRDRLRSRGQLAYYISQGRGAFWRCASNEHNPHQAQVFRRLYGNFDRIADVLDHIRRSRLPLSSTEDRVVSPLHALWRI
jgi:hypothetical protein